MSDLFMSALDPDNPFRLSSGNYSNFRIECDALSDGSWQAIADMIALNVEPFYSVVGVPRGGLKLAKCLEKYINQDKGLVELVVDDVYTSGKTMGSYMHENSRGIVLFARSRIVNRNVRAIFHTWL